jgi:hypothetical protein
MKAPENPYAFPAPDDDRPSDGYGMTLRDWFAGQALANPGICTGDAPEYELRRWFGDRCGIRATEIVARQALDYADAMLAARAVECSK